MVVAVNELLEVGEDADRKRGAPGVAAELEGGGDILLDVDRRLLRLDEEPPLGADAEAVVGGLDLSLDLEPVLLHHLAVRFVQAGGVPHVPAEELEERVEEVVAERGLLVASGAVVVEILVEAFDQVVQL